MRMRIKFISLIKIIFILILSIGFNVITLCQNTIPSKVIELPQGCKLILNANINLADTVSMNIVSGIRNILPKIQSLIPLESIAIKLEISCCNVLPFIGVGGRTNMDDSGVWIEYYYDPRNPNFRLESLINGLVHELNHASRMTNSDGPLTLLEIMVREGLADHFMIELTNCEQPQWSKALSEREINQYMIKTKSILYISQQTWTKEFDEWLLFGREGDDPIPRFTGYTLGWAIIENYLKAHPGVQASSLVLIPALELASSTPDLMDSK